MTGLDEHGCTGKDTCPLGTFQCATTKECLPEFRFCNAIADCKDLSDESEKKCRVEFQPSDFCPFRCDNGLCRSSAVVCSGVDGCGDNSDEKNCQVCRKLVLGLFFSSLKIFISFTYKLLSLSQHSLACMQLSRCENGSCRSSNQIVGLYIFLRRLRCLLEGKLTKR